MREKGFVTFREALDAQVGADLLLLVVALGPRSKIMLTQKVFEYLASGRPILALVPDGACRSTLSQFDEHFIVEPDDAEGIARALEEAYQRKQRGALLGTPREKLKRYERRELVATLAEKLNQIVSRD